MVSNTNFLKNVKIDILRVILIGVCLVLVFPFTSTAQPFTLATGGCPMVHCDPAMSDVSPSLPPSGEISLLWKRYEDARVCAWCATANDRVACSFQNTDNPDLDNLVVYDFDGNLLFTDSGILGSTAGLSGHLMGNDGGLIVADKDKVVRFDPLGQVVWMTPTNGQGGDQPLSLNLTESGQIVIASRNGPIAAYDKETGVQTSVLSPNLNLSIGSYGSLNTVGAAGNRIYFLGSRFPNKGALVAIDVSPTAMTQVWSFPFRSESGASPYVSGDTIFLMVKGWMVEREHPKCLR